MAVQNLPTARLWQYLALNEYAHACDHTGSPYPTDAILHELVTRFGTDGVERTAQFFTTGLYDHVDIVAMSFQHPDLISSIATSIDDTPTRDTATHDTGRGPSRRVRRVLVRIYARCRLLPFRR